MRGGTTHRGEKRTGYTIVEIMIFLAISGLMFVIATSFLSGRQASAEFRQSMEDINANLSQIINDVGNGYYPTNNSFKCTTTGQTLDFSSTATTQGSNTGCVFMGKIVQFAPSGTDRATYRVYSIAGRQQ